jgi:hypothetical protein
MEASKAQFKCIMQAISAIRLDDGPARPPLALEDAQPDLSMDSDDSSDTGFWKEANGIKPKLKPKPVSRSVHVHPSSEDSDDEMYCSEMVKKNMKKERMLQTPMTRKRSRTCQAATLKTPMTRKCSRTCQTATLMSM